MRNLSLEVEDLDTNLDNNIFQVTASSTLDGVRNEGMVVINNATTLSLMGDLTNNGIVDIASTGSNTVLSISDIGDEIVELKGTGRLVLNHATMDRVGGSTNHKLIQGAAHTIEGTGSVGLAAIMFENRGKVSASVAGEKITMDTRLEFTDSLPLPAPDANFFVRFGSDPDASP